MSQVSEIERLAQRRRILVAESQQLREQLAQELTPMYATITWVDRGYSLFRAVRPYWPIVAAVSGFLVARKRGSLLEWVRRAWPLVKLGQKFASAWQRRSFNDEGPAEAP